MKTTVWQVQLETSDDGWKMIFDGERYDLESAKQRLVNRCQNVPLGNHRLVRIETKTTEIMEEV